MINEIKFLIYNRQGYDIDSLKESPDMPKNYSYKEINKSIFGMISSTEIRRRIKDVKDI